MEKSRDSACFTNYQAHCGSCSQSRYSYNVIRKNYSDAKRPKIYSFQELPTATPAVERICAPRSLGQEGLHVLADVVLRAPRPGAKAHLSATYKVKHFQEHIIHYETLFYSNTH